MQRRKVTQADIQNALTYNQPKPDGATYGTFAVMALLFETENGLELLFTKRALTLKHQPGDICFPGGRKEKGEAPLETVLRETEEEIGIGRRNILILGEPDFVVTPYHAYIRPFVGLAQDVTPADIRFNPAEIDRVFTVPLQYFLEKDPLRTYVTYTPTFPESFPFDRIVGGKDYGWGFPRQPQYFYQYDGENIWGLTSRITRNVCKLVEQYWYAEYRHNRSERPEE